MKLSGGVKVPVYQYRCAEHGVFEVTLAMGAAAAWRRCAGCNADARRVFSPPLLSRTPTAVTAAIEHAEKSRFEPEVVAAPAPRPGARASRTVSNPLLQRLPRP
jgi:putative FmdB family regulatory protein